MRISDWSSDVCSSDLFEAEVDAQVDHARTGAVADHPRPPPPRRPSAVAVHDDGEVAGEGHGLVAGIGDSGLGIRKSRSVRFSEVVPASAFSCLAQSRIPNPESRPLIPPSVPVPWPLPP